MHRKKKLSYLPGVLGEAPLVRLEDLLAPGELELSTPESLHGGGAVVVLRADRDDDLTNTYPAEAYKRRTPKTY